MARKRGDRPRHRRGWSRRRQRPSSYSGSAFRTTDGCATYGQVAKLTAADSVAGDEFGCSVAISGDAVAVRYRRYLRYRIHYLRYRSRPILSGYLTRINETRIVKLR